MTTDLPHGARYVRDQLPSVWDAYGQLGEACATCGPIDARTARLIKLALAIGAASEGAVHSHTRRAVEAGIAKEELLQVAALAMPSLGFPRAVAALTWIADITDKR